jgi:hypothetical protein
MLLGKDFIGNIPKDDQVSVIFKDKNEFIEIGTSRDSNNVGEILKSFKHKSGYQTDGSPNRFEDGKNNLNFDKDIIKKFFSSLKKGSHAGKKFVFSIREDNYSVGSIHSRRMPKWILIEKNSDISKEDFEKYLQNSE